MFAAATDPSARSRLGRSTAIKRIGVIIGSTRPSRICPGIASWFRDAAQAGSPLSYELIDLAEVDLPFLDEPLKPALGNYEHQHTRAWSRLISSSQGFVFVFPQYNWGYPAPLKNALDFLYDEWQGKPATSVTYGTRGGSKGAEQIHGVFEGLHMRTLQKRIEIAITNDDLDERWQLRDPALTLRPYLEQVREIDVQMTETFEDSQG